MQQISKTKIKLFSSLRLKKNRKKHGMFLVEGRKLVQEAIKSSWKVENIIIREDKWDEFSDLSLENIEMLSIPTEGFDQLHSLQQSEGILAVVFPPPKESVEVDSLIGPAFLLEEIQDPGNMGTLIRTASWFGFEHVYCSKGCVDAYNPKVLRASMGGIFYTQVHYLENWRETLEKEKKRIYVGHLEGQKIHEKNLIPDSLILIGNEARGVDKAWIIDSDITKLSIPGAHKAESLNAAVAGSILAWEIFKTKF